MNLASLETLTKTPSTRALMERALDPHILLGMPHLNPRGLSETWLMKELGHRHWLMLARDMGMPDADFRTPDGREAYAAICATSLTRANLEAARANDVLAIHSSLSPVSRTQYSSLHHVFIGDDLIAVVELLSAFVARTRDGDNRSLTKMGLSVVGALPSTSSTLAASAAAFRRNQLDVCLELSLAALDIVETVSITPSVQEDFNGAGLLYFANFQALTTRAIQNCGEPARISRRDVFFHGNINPGETIQLIFRASKDRTRSVVELKRADGSMLGIVSTSSRETP